MKSWAGNNYITVFYEMFTDGSVILQIVYVVGAGEGTLLGHRFIKVNDFFSKGMGVHFENAI